MARQVGLKDLTIAPLTSDTSEGVVYETPEYLERAITAKITPSASSSKLYSDDSVEEVISSFDSIKVEIETNQLSINSRSKLLGSKIVKGVLVENKNDVAPLLALGFRSMKSDKTNYRHMWLLKGSFELVEDEFETVAENMNSKTAKLVGTFYAREYDGNYRYIADTDQEEINKTIITDWFTTVPEIKETI